MKAYMEKLMEKLSVAFSYLQQDVLDAIFEVLYFFTSLRWIKPYLDRISSSNFLSAAFVGWVYRKVMSPEERQDVRDRFAKSDREAGRSEEWIRERQESLLEDEQRQERKNERARQIKKSGKAVFAILGDELALPFAAFTVWLMLMIVVFLSGTPERVRLATTLVFVAIALFLAVKLVLSRKRGS